MTIEQFKNLMKQGNKVITGGMIDLLNNVSQFATIEFDDISCDKDSVNFSYVDRRHDMAAWQGERSPFYRLQYELIENIEQVAIKDDHLFGDYNIVVVLPSMVVDIYFDLVEGIDAKKYGLASDKELEYEEDYKKYTSSFAETKKKYIDLILDWEGCYVTTIDSQYDEDDSPCIQVSNTFFNLAGYLRNNELLNFSNINSESIHDNTGLFVEIGEIVEVEEVNEPDYFEIVCEKVIQFLMSDGSIVTIGLFQ